MKAERPMAPLGVLTRVPERPRTTLLARRLFAMVIILLLITALSPWQQSLSGQGRVIAYAPVERRQTIEAPVPGRVVRWYVREGSWVAEGEPLAELSDNDPNLFKSLSGEREATELKAMSYQQRLVALEAQIAAAKASLASEVAAAEAKMRATAEKLRAEQEKLKAAEASLETAALNVGRVRALHDQGLSATRDLELAELAVTKGRTERDAAQASVLAAQGDLDAARAGLDKARADGTAKLEDTRAKLSSGQSDAADARASLNRLDVSIARQNNQTIRAPRAGVVLQILAAQGGEQVKQGDPLALFVPDAKDRAAELWVDGNDAALIAEGRKVRLQFEGWPAVQFAGWPSVAVGTFGGQVAFVDPHDDGYGSFRVVVVPDPKDTPWPEARFLRQGVRAKGWVLLEQVRLGFELWRRFNGFPPVLKRMPEAPAKAKSKDEDKPSDGADKGKP